MRVRAWILLLLAAACGCGDGGEQTPKPPQPNPDGPNVLMIVMDTTRADRCSITGYRRSTTPHLEALAHESTVFRQAWSPASWTGPAHASLFTGLHVQSHGYLIGTRSYLHEDYVTLAETLRDSGYRTACFTNNGFVSPDYGLAQGFEVFEPIYLRAPIQQSMAGPTHDAALAWVQAVHRRGERFFLFINDMEPHLPYTPPRGFQDRFVAGGTDPQRVADARKFIHPLPVGYILDQIEVPPEKIALLGDLYDAEIATVDAAIGRLMERLERMETLDDTLVIILGDHGEALGEHHMLGHQYGMYRHLLHVPLLIRYPKRFEGGRKVDDLVRLEDILPTCLEVLGLPVPGDLDGKSLLRDLGGRIAIGAVDATRGLDQVRRDFPRADLGKISAGIRSAYDGRHHYLYYLDGREELFDLGEDPGETRNLMGERPDVARRLKTMLGDE